MTELLNGVEAPSDAELISRVRGGDVAAYGELYSRHVEAARRLGRQLVRGHDADDLVSDAFAKTLNVLQAGGGPDVAFRAYLLTSLRRLHVDRIRASKRVQPSDDMTLYDDGLPFQDPAVASFENGAAAKAFASLPERWQVVLWHLEVERQKPADIAPLLGMSANSVSALAYRAREGLRQAFLTMHLADCSTEECRWVNQRLGAYVRKGLSRRDTTKVEQHLDDCRRCTAMYLELSEVNSDLAGIIAPLLLGAAAAGYLSSAGGAGLTGVSALFGRVRDAVSGQAGGGAGAGATGSAATTTGAATAGGAVTAGGVLTAGGVIAAGVAAVTTAALVFGGSANERITEADRPVGVVQTPTPGGSEAGGESGTEEDRAGADEEAGATSPEGTSQVVVAAGEPASPDTATHDTPPAGSTDGSGGSQDTADGAAGTRPSDSTGASGGVPGPAPGSDGDTTVRPEPGDDPGEQTDGQEPDPVGGPHVDLPGPVAPVPVPTDPVENPPLDDTPVDPPPGPEQPPVEGGGTGGSGGGGETGGAEDEAAGPATGGGDQAGGGGQPAQEPTEPPAVVTTALTLVEPQIVAESLVFDLTVTDDGVLPDAVTVTLAPETGGIRFDPDGVTSTTKGSPAADRRALRVTIPLVIADPGADTLLSFTVSAGDAYLILDSSGAPLDEPVALTYQAPEAPETPQISVVAATPVPHGTFWDVHVAVADPDGVLPDMPEFKLRNADGTPVDERSLRIISVEAEDGGFVVRILVPDGQGSHVLALQAGEEGPVTGAFRVGREAPENDAPGGEAPEGNGGSTSPGGPKDDHTPADADRGDGQSGQGTRRDPEQPGHNDGGNEGGRAEGHVPDVPGMFRDRAAKAIDQLPAPRARGHVFGNDR